ncbi:MAG: sig7 [Actinomycetia bacterium]|nr:sig7 [Actinomycetes bacterium]
MSDATKVSAAAEDLGFEQHRAELTGYCYRMLGSVFEAEDAVQETLVRAWRAFDSFEGRAAVRTWLYRIATNVCLTMLQGRQRRALPMDLTPSWRGDGPVDGPLPENTWIQPIPDSQLRALDADPAEQAVARETIRIAFVAALQHLPPRQRAVLILREVLRWQATEVAELLDTTVVSVNSALQRARTTLAASNVTSDDAAAPMDEEQRVLLARYLEAFERFDVDALVSLLHEDATLSMPPFALWLQGHAEIRKWWFGEGAGCRGSRLAPTMANGSPAFGQWRPSGPDGAFEPWSIHVLDIAGGRIRSVEYFVDEKLFPLFDLAQPMVTGCGS